MKKYFYLIVLISTGFVNCNLEEISEINIAQLDATFTHSVDCYRVTFNNTSPEGSSFNWDFGNDQTSTEENPIFTFAGPGTFPVTLEVRTSQGFGSITKDVAIDWATFEGEYGSTSEDEQGIGIAQKDDGNYVAVGVSSNKIFGLEISSCGAELTNKVLSSENNIAPGSMIKLSNGKFAFTGFNNNGQNGFLFLLNEDLSEADLNNYAAPADVSTYYKNILETSNEQLVIYGRKFGASEGGWGMTFRKVDLSGKNKLAEKRYDGSAIPGDGALTEIAGNHFLLYGVHSDRIRVVELDQDLELVENSSQFNYITTPNIPGGFQSVSLEKLQNGNVVLFGTITANNGKWLPYLVLAKESGGVIFDKVYGEGEFQNAVPNFSSLQFQEVTDGFLLAGSADNFQRFFLMKTDRDGNLLWDKRYGTFGSSFQDLKVTSDGGYILTGSGAGAIDEQIFVIKTDHEGNVNL